MNLLSRLKRLESEQNVDDEFIYIRVGNPSFTLYGDEAKTYYEKRKAAGLLSEPKTEGGITFHRSKGPSLEELRDAEC